MKASIDADLVRALAEDKALAVNEVFATIQGEGRWTGRPSTFVRLQGCSVGCPFCDTQHTWDLDSFGEDAPEVVLEKGGAASPSWAQMTQNELIDAIARHNPRHVVITGGEPFEQDLTGLTHALLRTGRSVQVETSGTAPIACASDVWVTVSPKLGMPGGKMVQPHAIERADEIKMVIGRAGDVDALRKLLAWGKHRAHVPVYVQPMSRSEKATQLCINAALEHDWNLSIQVHALIGVR